MDNESFLDPGPFAYYFTKLLEPYADRVGPLIFEFGTFNKSIFPTPADFLARLDPFLAALPKGFRYAVEIRNPEYLSPAYFDTLAARHVAHTLNAWTRMPELADQAALPCVHTADFTVVRALLAKGRTYEKAVETYQPEKVQDPNERAREAMAEIAGGAVKSNSHAR
jgi:uncharacterized protein YecE (DUF72 family)